MQEPRAGLNGEQTPEDAAQYIASVAAELAQMARRNGFEALGYILEMAQLEADQAGKGLGDQV